MIASEYTIHPTHQPLKFDLVVRHHRIVARHNGIKMAVAQYFPTEHKWLVADMLEPKTIHQYCSKQKDAILALRRYVGARAA